jgi:hypothetical protein
MLGKILKNTFYLVVIAGLFAAVAYYGIILPMETQEEVKNAFMILRK